MFYKLKAQEMWEKMLPRFIIIKELKASETVKTVKAAREYILHTENKDKNETDFSSEKNASGKKLKTSLQYWKKKVNVEFYIQQNSF